MIRTSAPFTILALLFAAPAASGAPPAQAPAPPPTERRPVTDQYHGHKITDDYRWLEDFSDPAVKRWNAAQNQYTRKILDAIPALPAIQRRAHELAMSAEVRYFDLRYRGGLFFARKRKPPADQPSLVVLRSPDDPASERVLLDPLKLNPQGTTTIDFYTPSLDGELIAVSLSDRGTEDGTVHVYEVKTGRKLPDVIPRVHGGTAGGSLCFTADRGGFYYTRYPYPGERPKEDLNFYQQVYFHKLGAPIAQDRPVLGPELPRIAETFLQISEDGSHVLAEVANGDGGEMAHFLLSAQRAPGAEGTQGPKWTQLTQFTDQVVRATFGRDGALYLVSRKNAPRGRVLRLPLSGSPRLAAAEIVVPEGEAVIEGVAPTRGRLYVVDVLGGVSQVRAFDLAGRPQGPLPLPKVASVGQMLRLAPDGDEVLFRVQTFTDPPGWYRYAPATGKITRTALHEPPRADFSDVEVVRDFATSRDGTKVPLTVLVRKGARRDGQNPTMLTGYGGFGISLTPHYDPMLRLWLEQGGVMAIANLRGGGEYGDAWHRDGYLTRKQNVFDDFLACAQYLIDRKYTSPARLAIEGGSNGGLLMGAAATQRPDLFRAVVAHVGLFDMLRFALYPNGSFNVTEYGSVADLAQFKALYAYSPYHRVKDGTAYPAMLFISGENDPRVNPADSRKMVARLQAATASGRPVLLRTSATSGHVGKALSEAVRETADAYAFLFDQLGVTYRPQRPSRPTAARPK
jgi:prolyl oligopeptidase